MFFIFAKIWNIMSKSMKTDRTPIPTKKTLEDVPARKIWDKDDPNAPKSIPYEATKEWKEKQDKRNKKTRAGMLYHSIIPGKKPFMVRDGDKLK